MRVRGRPVHCAIAVFAALLLLLPLSARAGDRLVIFAAASLKNALDNVSAAYTSETDGEVVVSYAGSSALARQIEQGAPADVFISADVDWMDYLSSRGLTKRGTELRLLGNSLVLIAPSASDAETTIEPGFDLAALIGGGRLAIANTDAVPAGKYAKAALEALGVWDTVKDRTAQAENVRAALALVSTGEAPLGIVYLTDAMADTDVRIVGRFPAETHPPIVYPAAVLSGSDNPASSDYLEFVGGDTARTLFEAQGFAVIAPQLSN